MQLRRIYLRYFPPGLRLEYALSSGQLQRKTIDLLHVSAESNIQHVVNQLLDREKLLAKTVAPKLKELLHCLVEKQLLYATERDPFQLHSVHRPHALPMANFACSKRARVVATCSYDKTIKLFKPFERRVTADDKISLTGHEGVVFCVAFNKPHARLLLSGSFDKTCRIWDVESKTSKGIYKGHEGEVVGAVFGSTGEYFGSCSMDCTSAIWDVETETEKFALVGHTAEVSCLAFDSTQTLVATGSCDSTVRLWDVRYGTCFRSLEGHDGDISNVMFDYQSNLLVSSSADRTSKIWDVRNGKCLFDLRDHQSQSEVNDVTFNSTGALVATCGSDGKAFIYDTLTGTRRTVLHGHSKSISKVVFNMQGSQLMTASADGTARLWNAFSGECLQVLRGHEEEVFSCAFSYDGSIALTASTDNLLRVWEREKD